MNVADSASAHAFPRPVSLLESKDPSHSVATMATRVGAIDEHDRVLHAFLPEANRRERLCHEAAGERESSPLHGALVGIKDIIRVDGFETRAGSALPADALAGPQATLVDRLVNAGAIVAGKTVTAEFAHSAPGPTRNPRDLARTPGGSSSGSAAAVAAGLIPLAIGTQTLGSIIRPAAFCGVVGFRPTWGTIPTDGVIAHAPSLDTVGMFAADVDSIELAARVLCDWDGGDPAVSGLPILGLPTGEYLHSATPEGRRAFHHHVDLLREAGYEIRDAPLVPDTDGLRRALFTVQRFELAQVHSEWWREFASLYNPATAAAILEGQRITAEEYTDAIAWRNVFREQLASAMSSRGIDMWVTPSAPGLAPLGLSSTGDAVMSAPFSFAGLPAVSLPAPNPDGGIAFGLQCVAGAHRDRELLTHARGLAAVLDQSRAA